MVLQPGILYLGRTVEFTATPYHVPMLSGRSSIARLGMCIHVTAGFGDIGFQGYWTLEITVVHPLRVYAGTEVCQIYYDNIQGAYEHYKGKYDKNHGIQSSMLWKDFKK